MKGVEALSSASDEALRAMDLERVFARCFAESTRTRLVGGSAEPLYEPAGSAADWNRIHYREDFFASVLHEVAHWCIAGRERRRLADYGYWYRPEGRSGGEQHAFMRVEARPQALEWVFSRACGAVFRLSFDNPFMEDDHSIRRRFARRVVREAETFRCAGLPPRAGVFCDALCLFYGISRHPLQGAFTEAALL